VDFQWPVGGHKMLCRRVGAGLDAAADSGISWADDSWRLT
jgi:hypothetical protein